MHGPQRLVRFGWRGLALAELAVVGIAVTGGSGRPAPVGAQDTISAVLFPDMNYLGVYAPIHVGVPDLTFTVVGNDKTSSLRLSLARTVALWSDINPQGTCQTFTKHTPDLRGTKVGNDAVSSVRGGTHC